MTMYDAPSDRDYADWLYFGEPEMEDPDNELPPTPQYKERSDADDKIPF